MPPTVVTCTVISNKQEGPAAYRLWLEGPQTVCGALPGQFVNVRTSDSATPLLRRPFSFCEIDEKGGRFSLLYQVVGPGTGALSNLRGGHTLSVVGPLGNGFDTTTPAEISILCAGGIGVAPFPAVAQSLLGRSDVRLILGARRAGLCLLQQDFTQMGVATTLATEDGSAGARGFVTEPLREALQVMRPGQASVYACGPQPMLRAVEALCRELEIPGQFSVESVMGCGVGACLSCVFPTPDGRYIRSCHEGPVFRSGEILF